MKIIFSCLGFATAEVLITDINKEYPGQYFIGYLYDRYNNEFDFHPTGIYVDRLKDILPTPTSIVEEYKTQYNTKGVCINPDGIVYAG